MEPRAPGFPDHDEMGRPSTLSPLRPDRLAGETSDECPGRKREHLRHVAGSKSSNRVLEIGNDVFLKLLLAELKNQDPLSPMDNHQLVEQIAQLRAVEANMRDENLGSGHAHDQSIAKCHQSAGPKGGRSCRKWANGAGHRGSGHRGRFKVKLAVGEETILLENIRSIEGTSSGFWGSGLL